MRRSSTLALALALAMPMVAQAQGNYAPNAGNLRFSGDLSSNGTVAGYNVGPYKAEIQDFTPMLDNVLTPGFASIWCVDFGHVAPSSSAWDTYWATAFDANSIGNDGDGDYSMTRVYGSTAGSAALKNSASNTLYRQAAWLIEQYDPTKDGLLGVGLYNATNIQGTIWNLFGAGLNANGSNNFFQLTVASDVTLTRDWFVLSDNMSAGESSSNQEFLTYRATPSTFIVTSTPEPSTYALMAAGLIAMGVVARRRRVIAKV